MKVINKIGHFKLVRDSRDFIVINELGDYAAHAHFKSEAGARDCIRLINKGLLPRNEYYVSILVLMELGFEQSKVEFKFQGWDLMFLSLF